MKLSRIIIGAGALALTFFAGVGIGNTAVGPSENALPPTPTKTVTTTKTVPGPVRTTTVVRTKDVSPQSCRDALASANRAFDLSGQFMDINQRAIQAIIDNDTAALNKATADVNAIKAKMASLSPLYRADATACEAAK